MNALSNRQIFMIASALTLDTTLISIPSMMVGAAKQDAVFSLLPAIGVIMAAWVLIYYTMRRFPMRDLLSVLVERFPVTGRVLTASYVLFFFFTLARDIRSLSDFVNYALLPRTPIMIVALTIGLCIALIARSGIESLGRLTEIYQAVLIVIILALPVLLLRELELYNLEPPFEFGASAILHGGWYASGFIGDAILLTFIVSNRPFPLRQGLYGLLFGGLLLEILIVYCLGVLGSEMTSRFIFPNYHLIREIRITDFLDRFDIAIVGVWMPAMMVKISFAAYFVCHGLKCSVPGVSAKVMALPVTLLSVICSFWFFPNYIQILHLNESWPALALVFQFGLPLLLFFVLKPKNDQPLNA